MSLWDGGMTLSKRVVDPFHIIRILKRKILAWSLMNCVIRFLAQSWPTVSIVNCPIDASYILIRIRIRIARRVDSEPWSKQKIFELTLLYRRKCYRRRISICQNVRVKALPFYWIEFSGIVQIHVIILVRSWHLSLISALHVWSESILVGRIFDKSPSSIRFEHKIWSMNLIALARFTVLLYIARCIIIHRICEMIICCRWTDWIRCPVFSIITAND